jgi:DNA repair photolyase
VVKIKEVQVGSYLTASKLPDADWVVNPYVGCPHKCIYCYAEFMKRFTNHTEEDWGNFLDIKLTNKPTQIDKIGNASVLFGSVTDAYNPYEKKYELTRKILSEFIGSNAKVEILTKSDLVTRDIDLLKKITDLRVGISMNTLDDSFRKLTEPHASSVDKRIEALKILHDSGIKTYLFMSPIFPQITRFNDIVEYVQPFADSFYFENLNLRAGYLPRVLSFISENYPEHLEIYNAIYRKKDMNYWEQLSNEINTYCHNAKLDFKLYFYHDKIKKGAKHND